MSATATAPAPVCQLPSREWFHTNAKPVVLCIDGATGDELLAEPRTMSTGSLGWFVQGKASVMIGGQSVRVQVSGTMTIIHSKTLV